MSIAKLCEGASDSRPVHKRFDAKTLKAYIKDLKELAKLIDAGKGMPTRHALKIHFEETLGMHIQEETIQRHFRVIRAGGLPWDE